MGCGNAKAPRQIRQPRGLMVRKGPCQMPMMAPMPVAGATGLGAYAAWTKQKAEVNLNCRLQRVATNQMGDRSVLEPMKVVPSRDITPGRRKEPMNRG